MPVCQVLSAYIKRADAVYAHLAGPDQRRRMRSLMAEAKSTLHERRYAAELRGRGPDGLWSVTATYGEASLDLLAAEHPSVGWSAAASRIAGLKRGDHTRVELEDDTALILTRR